MSAEADIEKLMEMGLTRLMAEQALKETGYHGVQAATEWLFSSQATEEGSGGDTDISSSDEELGAGDASGDARYIVCDTCGVVFRGRVAMQVHASVTNHSTFRELSPSSEIAAAITAATAAAAATKAAPAATAPATAAVATKAAPAAAGTEEKKPVTEEEKQEQKKKVEELIKQRRAEKEEQEKRENIEKEKIRRRTGQELMSAKQKFEQEEMKRLAEQRRREKLEDKLRKQQILDEIERDKIARKEMFAMAGTSAPSAAFGSAAQMQQQMAQEKKEYTECKLQIRLTNGECIAHTFGPNEELAAVRLYIQMNRTDGDYPFTLMTAFPRRVFKEEEMHCTLESLGLVPSAVLIVTNL